MICSKCWDSKTY